MRRYAVLTLVLVMVAVVGCSQHSTSEDPPIHLVQNMDDQLKVKPQSESKYYADGLAMRTPIEGTVARGQHHPDSAFFYTGMDNERYLKVNPRSDDDGLLARGEERYRIFCEPCHGAVGGGKSIMVEKKMPPPPSFHEFRLRDSADGYFFHVISNGLGNMPPYKYQIPPKDRWAIVSFIRALQGEHPAAPNSTPESRAIKEQ